MYPLPTASDPDPYTKAKLTEEYYFVSLFKLIISSSKRDSSSLGAHVLSSLARGA